MEKGESVFAAIWPNETRAQLEEIITEACGGQRPENLDAALWQMFCACIEHSELDPLRLMLRLAASALDLNKAGCLTTEFRGRALRTLAALGRRAQVEILTSEGE